MTGTPADDRRGLVEVCARIDAAARSSRIGSGFSIIADCFASVGGNIKILMITGCFDAAGKLEDQNTPLVVVAGFASMSRVWADFEADWLAVLNDFNLPYFHAGDFAHSKKPFTPFKNDEPARRDFLSKLMAVIKQSGFRKFGALIKKKDFAGGLGAMGLTEDPNVDPFVLCSRYAVDGLHKYSSLQGVAKETITTIFDKGDSEQLLRAHFDHHEYPTPDFRWSRPVIKNGYEQPKFIGLQAAGWIAWEYYLDACRVFGVVDRRPDNDGRFTFREFESILGQIDIVYVSKPGIDIRNRVLSEYKRKGE